MILLLLAMVFSAALVHTLSGFGFALIAMPLMTLVIGFQITAPLVAMSSLTLNAINLARYGHAINFSEFLRLGVASAIGVPVGVWALSGMAESTVKLLLGLILVGYASYRLLRPSMPQLKAQSWAYVAGFAAGCLGGAYNVPGPPAVIYGNLRHWPKQEFRAVLQALFLVNASLVVLTHWLAHHLTADVLTLYLRLVPSLLLGVLAGSRMDNMLRQDHFRKLVTVLLLGLGLSLALGIGPS